MWISRSAWLLGSLLILIIVSILCLLLIHTRLYSSSAHPSLCKEAQVGELRNRCFYTYFDRVIKEEGISGALDKYRKHLVEQPFSASCHAVAHHIGAIAFQQVNAGAIVRFSSDMDNCSFGFFHGFMVEAAKEYGSYGRAVRTFCDASTQGDLIGENIPKGECFHGIGNAIAYDNIILLRQPDAYIYKTQSACHEVSRTQGEYFRCMGGVYNASGNKYPTVIGVTTTNPLSLCNSVKDSTIGNCYGYMATVLAYGAQSFSDKLAKVATGLSIKDQLTAVTSLSTRMAVRLQDTSVARVRDACRKAAPLIEKDCIGAYVRGLIQTESAERLDERAVTFCSSVLLSDKERVYCFDYIFIELSKYKSMSGKLFAVCQEVSDSITGSCLEGMRMRNDHPRLGSLQNNER